MRSPGDLFLFDLTTRKEQSLVKNTGAFTLWPAVSPDGKQVAVARRVVKDKGAESMQIIIYDLKGKEQHRSPEFTWREPSDVSRKGILPPGLFWNREGTRLVVYDLNEVTTGIGIYDVGQKRTTRLQGCPLLLGTTPVRPDGKGFLILNGNKKEVEVAFVDWDGKKQKIDMKPDTLDTEVKRGMIVWSCLVTSYWQGDTAVINCSDTSIRIDTNKKVGTYHKLPQEEAKAGEMLVRQQYTFPDKGARVRVLMKEEDKKAEDEKCDICLEVLKPGQKMPKTLRRLRSGIVVLFPSPDGKHLAVLYNNVEIGDMRILVLDSAGEEVAEVG